MGNLVRPALRWYAPIWWLLSGTLAIGAAAQEAHRAEPPAELPLRPLQPGELRPADFHCHSSIRASPDNQCEVTLTGVRGTYPGATILVSDRTHVRLMCSTERGGFSRELLVTSSASHRIGVSWLDAHTLVVGIPVDAHFARPVRTVENFGERIDIRYVPVVPGAGTSVPPVLECLEDPAWNGAALADWQPEPLMPVPASGEWIAFDIAGECVLWRLPAWPGRHSGPGSVAFVQSRRAAFPFGTTDLVFFANTADSPIRVTALLDFGEPAPVPLSPSGPRRGWHVTGATAERILETLRNGMGLRIELIGDEPRPPLLVAASNFAAAAGAFDACRARRQVGNAASCRASTQPADSTCVRCVRSIFWQRSWRALVPSVPMGTNPRLLPLRRARRARVPTPS